jgi:hypothetical protein
MEAFKERGILRENAQPTIHTALKVASLMAREFERIRNPFPILTSLQFPSTSR